MKNVKYEKCYLDLIRIVINHDNKSDLVLNYANFFKELSQKLNGKIENLQVSDDELPEVPRLVITCQDFSFVFALNRVEAVIRGSRKHLFKDALYDFYRAKIKDSIGFLESYFAIDNFEIGFVGIIAPIRFPQDLNISKEELVSSICSKFNTNCNGRRTLTYNLKLGFYDDSGNYFLNYNIKDYTIKNFNKRVLDGEKGTNTYNYDDFPTVEQGVIIELDVNNRPMMKKKDPLSKQIISMINLFFEKIKENDLGI